MDETRIDAQLPQLNVEVVRRDYPEDRAEVMTIKMTATPSFKAVGGLMTQGLAGPMTSLWAAPVMVWAGMIQAAWGPVLGAMAPRVTMSNGQAEAPQVTTSEAPADKNGKG